MIFTRIYHEARESLDLTPYEYMICDIISLSQSNKMYSNENGCTHSYQTLAGFIRISKRSVIRLVKNLEEKGIVVVNGRSKKVTKEWDDAILMAVTKVHQNGEDVSPLVKIASDDVSPLNGEDMSPQKVTKVHQNGDDMSPHKGKDNLKEEVKEVPPCEKSFSFLNTNHEELVKYLLKKPRKLVELLPKGEANEIANNFASYWVGQNRSFTNTPKQRKWVGESLLKWAEFEKPKNETSEIKAIVKRIWKKELNDKELQFITRKISNGVTEEDLIDVLAYAKTNIMSENRTNPYFVFGDNFKKYLEHSKEEAA